MECPEGKPYPGASTSDVMSSGLSLANRSLRKRLSRNMDVENMTNFPDSSYRLRRRRSTLKITTRGTMTVLFPIVVTAIITASIKGLRMDSNHLNIDISYPPTSPRRNHTRPVIDRRTPERKNALSHPRKAVSVPSLIAPHILLLQYLCR